MSDTSPNVLTRKQSKDRSGTGLPEGRNASNDSFSADILADPLLSAELLNSGSRKLANSRAAILLGGDLLAIAITLSTSYLLTEVLRLALLTDYFSMQLPPIARLVQIFGGVAVAFILVSHKQGHYKRFHPIWTEIGQVFQTSFYILVFFAAIMFLSKTPFPRVWFITFTLLLAVTAPLIRCGAKLFMMRSGMWFKSTYVVGVGENAAYTAATLESDRWMGHRVVGYIKLRDDDLVSSHIPYNKVMTQSMVTQQQKESVETPCIVFAFESLAEWRRNGRIFNRFIASKDSITLSPPIRGLPMYGAEVINVFKDDTVILRLSNNLSKKSSRITKRLFDIVISLASILLLLPVFAVLWAWVKLEGGPAFFAHERVGLDGKSFKCLKFRSMALDADEQLSKLLSSSASAREEWKKDHKLKDDPRITRVGGILRKTSLDELPQLFNVLRGEMSLVGPRPIAREEVPRYGEHFPYYCMSIPGITGLWQSSGRNNIAYDKRVELDVWYARNWSLWHDVVIIARTVPSLLFSRGAY